MNYWNPKNKRFLFFHEIYGMSHEGLHFYYRVDTVNQRVWKLTPIRSRAQGRYMLKGVYEIKWSTFISGVCQDLSFKSRSFTTECEKKDGRIRTHVLYTTENQWLNHLRELVIEITTD